MTENKDVKKEKLNFNILLLLNFLALLLLAFSLSIKSFFPLMEINEEEGRMHFLGGAIKLEKFFSEGEDEDVNLESKFSRLTGDLPMSEVETIEITANHNNLKINHSEDSVRYKCHSENKLENIFSLENKILRFNLPPGTHCSLSLPSKVNLNLKGAIK